MKLSKLYARRWIVNNVILDDGMKQLVFFRGEWRERDGEKFAYSSYESAARAWKRHGLSIDKNCPKIKTMPY